MSNSLEPPPVGYLSELINDDDPIVAAVAKTCCEWSLQSRRLVLAKPGKKLADAVARDGWRMLITDQQAELSYHHYRFSPHPKESQLSVIYFSRLLIVHAPVGDRVQTATHQFPLTAPAACLADLFGLLANSLSRGRPAAMLTAHSLCRVILLTVLEHLKHPVLPDDSRYTRKVRNFYQIALFMAANMDQSISTRDAAKGMSISPQYLNRICRDLRQMNFSTYLNFLRLERARAELLEDHASKIAQLATKYGFNSSAYFVKSFRELYGQPPLRLRKRLTAAGTNAPVCLHSANGFELLLPVNGAVNSGPDRFPHVTVIVANATQSTYHIDWLSPRGTMEPTAPVGPGERMVQGVPRRNVLSIRADDGASTIYQVGHCNCQIIIV